MLVLSRKSGESVFIDERITVTVLGIQGSRVKLGFEAPRETPIIRKELRQKKQPAVADLIGEIDVPLSGAGDFYTCEPVLEF